MTRNIRRAAMQNRLFLHKKATANSIRCATGQPGIVLIEMLVAALIVGLSLASLVSMWQFSYRMTLRVDDKGITCNLARQAMEAIKQTGFDNTAEISAASPVVHYYDALEQNKDASPTSARYKVTISVVSDTLSSGTPAADALRTVTITVTLISTGETLCQTSTYLARSGV